MQEIKHTIKDPMGLHARPAGVLVKELKQFTSSVEVVFGEKSVNAKGLMGLMGLGIKQGNEILFRIEGEDEQAAAKSLTTFLETNL